MGRLAVALIGLTLASPVFADQGERVRVTGEMIDTWCYFSGVMGGPDSVVGSAHHTCAMWCAAGGIPVGLRADDGTVYMVLQWQDDTAVTGGDTILEIQSDRITADGIAIERDGVRYLIVAKVVSNEGIANRTHEEFGVVPPFAIPEANP